LTELTLMNIAVTAGNINNISLSLCMKQ